jgi:hypothetical protein
LVPITTGAKELIRSMFGRKRKREDETPGLSVPYVSQPPVTMPVTMPIDAEPGSGATPAPPAPPATQPQPPAQAPFATTGMAAGQLHADMSTMLNQLMGANGQIGDLLAEIKKDPQAFRERMIAQAQAAGVSTFVMTPQGITHIGGTAGAAGAAPAPQHVDVIDELTKAAALHDKGALTDAEFEDVKKKLLGQ